MLNQRNKHLSMKWIFLAKLVWFVYGV